jgi:peptide/nickel transport system permease protein
VGLFALLAAIGFTPLLTSRIDVEVGASFEGPGLRRLAVWAGTDILGRSSLWRLLYGARVALVVALTAAALAAVVGATLGVVAGYFRGWVDGLILWLFSTVNSIPWVLLMVASAYALRGRELSLFGHEVTLLGAPSVVLALGLTSWVGLCRLVRGEVLGQRERDYVVAARAVGLSDGRILVRHVLPNVFHLVIIDFTLNMVAFIQAEVVLSFLGLGIVDQPSWGRVIDDGRLELMRGVWWQVGGATLLIFALSLALNLLGDALRDALDPRLGHVG